MVRKLTLNGVAVVVVVLLAGASLAATSTFSAGDRVELSAPAVLPAETDTGVGSDPPDENGAVPDDPSTFAEPQDLEEAVEPHDAALDDDDAVDLEAQEDAGDGFGVVRSAQARAFGECMEAAEDHEARAACRELRPGPAHLHPDHPTGGPSSAPGRADGGEDGERPGPPAHARGGGEGERPGPPAHAGGRGGR